MPASVSDAGTSAPETPGSGGTGGFSALDDGGGHGGGGVFGDPARFGLLAFLGTVSMLFVGFTSAYIVRRSSADWRPIGAPVLLWLNTALLVASSLTLESARRRLSAWDLRAARDRVVATGALGVLFVAGQLLAWRQLAVRGVYLASNPHSSFFYVLTGLHAVHLAGGLVWLTLVLSRFARMTLTPGQDGLRLFATYWHFLGGLWIYLVLLLFVF